MVRTVGVKQWLKMSGLLKSGAEIKIVPAGEAGRSAGLMRLRCEHVLRVSSAAMMVEVLGWLEAATGPGVQPTELPEK